VVVDVGRAARHPSPPWRAQRRAPAIPSPRPAAPLMRYSTRDRAWRPRPDRPNRGTPCHILSRLDLTWEETHAMEKIVSMFVLLIAPPMALALDVPAAISQAVRDDHGLLVHMVRSEYQAGTTEIRLLLPDRLETGRRYPAVYVLPVEARNEHRYGNGLLEVR